MDYTSGELFKKNNIRFKDNSSLDLRIGGHPATILIDIEEDAEYIYYLTLTSKAERYVNHESEYYPVTPDRDNGLSKPSLVNLRHIYKDPKTNVVTKGILSDRDYFNMISKFIEYQRCNEDEFFSEVVSFLQNYIDTAVNE